MLKTVLSGLVGMRRKTMKTYKKQMRAVALEVGDLHFKLGREEYPWYDEDDFPADMEEFVEKDKPFGGWYEYKVEERYVPFVGCYSVSLVQVLQEKNDNEEIKAEKESKISYEEYETLDGFLFLNWRELTKEDAESIKKIINDAVAREGE
jgi:hypothetical protein